MASFGERLRQLRRAAGLSQGELAGDGLSASYISLLEAGKRTPSSAVVHQLATRLNCSGSQLLDGQPSERDQRIELEMAYARLAIEHGECVDARSRLERLLAEDGIPPRDRDEITLLVARACERTGDLDAAVRFLLPLYERARSGQAAIPVSMIAITLCGCYLDSGDLNQGVALGEQALVSARESGLGATADYFRLAATVMSAYLSLGDYLHARTWADTLLAEAEASGAQSGQAALYWNAAVLAEHEGRMDESLHLIERAMGHLSELDNTRDYARLRVTLAGILLGCDPPRAEQASAILDRTIDDVRDLGSQMDLAEWNYLKSATLLYQGDASGAEGRARQALDLLDGKVSTERCAALLALQDAIAAQGRDAEAGQARALAFSELSQAAGSRPEALQWRALAERMTDLGDHSAAAEAYRRALDGAGIRDRSRAAREMIRQLRTQVTHPASLG
jgi:transcriptional regulator with XRE-family HTH domain